MSGAWQVPGAAAAPPSGEAEFVAALRRGDDRAFAELVDELSSALLSVARIYVPTPALAEDVLQETWLGVMRGIDRFEGRSSLRTWIFRILINIAKTRGAQERRTIPFSSAAGDDEGGESLVDPERFLGPHHRLADHWAMGPTAWDEPDEALLAGETREAIVRAIDSLPPAQREVITLRDIGGWDSDDVCAALGISPGNQRVILHRARTKVRAALEEQIGGMESTL